MAALALVLLSGPAGRPLQAAEDDLFLGLDALFTGRFERADRVLTEFTAAQPDNELAHSALVETKIRLDRHNEAARLLDIMAERFPDNHPARLWRVHLALSGRHDDQAGRLLAELPPDSARDPRAYLYQALSRLRRGEDREAAAALDEARRLDPPDPEVRFALARAFAALSMPANARLELEAALERNPRHLGALKALAQGFFASGQKNLAADAWRQILAMDPTQGQARFQLSRSQSDEALAASFAGDKGRAAHLYRQALETDPANQAAAAWLREAPRPEQAADRADDRIRLTVEPHAPRFESLRAP